MYFEAQIRDKKFKIEVFESRSTWTITLQEESGEKEVHKISKTNYRSMDNAVNFLFENSSYMIDVVGAGLDYTVYTRGSFRTIRLFNDESLLHESLKQGGALGGSNQLTSGMPGKIVDVLVKQGQIVHADQPLLIMEAMKMENEMRASKNVKVKEVRVEKGQSVEAGAVLLVFEPVDS